MRRRPEARIDLAPLLGLTALLIPMLLMGANPAIGVAEVTLPAL